MTTNRTNTQKVTTRLIAGLEAMLAELEDAENTTRTLQRTTNIGMAPPATGGAIPMS